MSRKDIINESFNPLDFIEGVSPNFVLNLALRKTVLEKTINYTFEEYPSVGIVRLVELVKNVTEMGSVNQKELKDDLTFQNSKNISIYKLLVEVDGITKTYLDYFKGNINKNIFFSSLLEIYVSNEERVPIKDELIKLAYGDEKNFLTIKFDGYLSDKRIMDPNLEKYVKDKKSPTKSFFDRGSGLWVTELLF